MLTSTECQGIFDVAVGLRSKLATPIPPYTPPRRSNTLHTICRDLLLKRVDKDFPTADTVERRATAALSYLSPTRTGRLPHPLLANRLRVIDAERGRIGKVAGYDLLLEDPDLLLDIVLALALGWWPAKSGVKKVCIPDWQEPWLIALQELVEMATELVARGVADLKSKGLRIPADLFRVGGWGEAAAGDFVFCSPGTGIKGSAGFRHLAFWEPGPRRRGAKPGRRTLTNWLRHAVYGDFKSLATGKPNMVRNGLLFPTMAAEGWLRVAKKAFRVCLICGEKNEYDGEPCASCLQQGETAPYIVRGEDMLLVPGQYRPKVFRRLWPVDIPPVVAAHLRPSEIRDPAKNLKLYVEEGLYLSGALPVKAKKTSQNPTSLFVKAKFASPPDGIYQAVGVTAEGQVERLQRALALLPEAQRTRLILWAESLNGEAIAAPMDESEMPQEEIDALKRLMDETDDGWPGDSGKP